MRRPPALGRADFRSLWLAGLISDAGDWMLFVALPILVYTETGSALGTSLAFLIELAPGIVLAPWAGAIADGRDRRRTLLVLTLLQAVALLPLVCFGSHPPLPVLYGVILAEASLSALFDPTKNALLPTLLAPGELISANALIAFNASAGRLVGGPLGGLLLAAGQLRLIVVADAVSLSARRRADRTGGAAARGFAAEPPGPHRARGPGGRRPAFRARRPRGSLGSARRLHGSDRPGHLRGPVRAVRR